MNLRAILKRVLVYGTTLYLLACAGLYFYQAHLVFPIGPGNFHNCPEMTKLGAVAQEVDGIRYFEKSNLKNKITLVFFHGNGSTACDHSWVIDELKDLPLNFVVAEYQGYAQTNPNSPPPIEKVILNQAENLVSKFATTGAKTILFGESLGSGIATYAASKQNVSGLIVQSPYTSIAEVGQERYPLFPVRMLSKFPFAASEWAPNVKAPVLVLQAEHDATISPRITAEQIRNFQSNIQLTLFPGAGHNEMKANFPKLYWDSVRGFIKMRAHRDSNPGPSD